MQRVLVGLALALSILHAHAAEPDEKAPFALSAEPKEVLEGGPFVLRMTLEYRGKKQLKIDSFSLWREFVRIKPPAHWKGCERDPGRNYILAGGDPFAPKSIMPGEKRTYDHYFHLEYSGIPAGQATFLLECDIYNPRDPQAGEKEPKLLQEISQRLTLTIPRATPDRVRQLVARRQAELQQINLQTYEEKGHVENSLVNCSHKELLPLGLTLLASKEHVASEHLLEWMYELSDSPSALTTALTDAIRTENPHVLERVFSYWQMLRADAAPEHERYLLELFGLELKGLAGELLLCPHRLLRDCASGRYCLPYSRMGWLRYVRACNFRIPDPAWQKLTESRNLWIRTFTCATFPERCNRDWRTRLLADLPRLAQPLPPEEVQPLLLQLEHRQFAVRQRATQQLIQQGDRVTAALVTTLGQRPSLEVRHRVLRILEAHAVLADHPPHRRLLPLLVGRNNPEAIALVEALAKGDDSIQLTRDARKLLKEMRATPQRP